MRIKLLLMLAIISVLASCKKSDTQPSCELSKAVAPAAEIDSVKKYLANNSITATQHPSGVFYVITNLGSGAVVPTGCTAVTVKYDGKLTNGNAFDNSSPNYPNGIVFRLGNLISGWQIGIPLIKKGGSITLYLPPSLGYGGSSSATIPANSILIFNIELVNVQ